MGANWSSLPASAGAGGRQRLSSGAGSGSRVILPDEIGSQHG